MNTNALPLEIRFESGPISVRSRTLPFRDMYEIYQGLEPIEYKEFQRIGAGWENKKTKITLENVKQSHPFALSSRRRAIISTVDSHAIASYAGISRTHYLKICCLQAATQLRALALNPHLEAEDLPCWRKSKCLFAWQDSFPEYAMVFEKRLLCSGCANFYNTLGVGREFLRLKQLIASLQTSTLKGH